ncbi:MAG: ABC transporter permease [Azospirillaceae bacterium]
MAAPGSVWRRARDGRALPIVTVLAVLFLVWYAASIWLNAPRAAEALDRGDAAWGTAELIAEAWSMDRPVLPAPHQIAANFWASTVEVSVTSRRSLVYHATVTMSATLSGFVLGTVLGIVIAIGIVHIPTLDRSLMPWVIASQTVPILAIAPMIVVVLGNLGLTGVLPKAIISAYLSFFPVAIGMVKGLRSPDRLHLDLMRTYSADRRQILAKLRWPAAVPFLFPSLKVGIALSLVGAIVAELPTGAQAGIGARLLTGSYYGQMVAMWAALITAAMLAMICVFAVDGAQKLAAKGRGGRL